MAKPIPKSPVPLEAFLRALLAGDDKHRPGKALPPDLRALLEATLKDLASDNETVRTSRETYRSTSKTRKGRLPQGKQVAEQIRHAVYAMYTTKAEELSDYGLVPKKRPHRKSEEASRGGSVGHGDAQHRHASGETAASAADPADAKGEGTSPQPDASAGNADGTTKHPASR